jgi:hypothetical protein
MPQPSYLQTLARRAESDLPLLMPPRSVLLSRRESPLSRVDMPLMPELADEVVPVRLPSPDKETVISPQQQFPVAPLREAASLPSRSSTDSDNPPPLSVPSRVELPGEIKTAPVLSEMSFVSSPVQPALQQPGYLAPQPTTSVTQPLQSSDSSAALPDLSAQIPDLAPENSVPQSRSYLQTAARILTSKPSSAHPSVSSAETVAPEVPLAFPSVPSTETVVPEAPATATAVSKVSESVVVLQPLQNNPVAKNTSPNSQNLDLLSHSDRRPSRSPTPPPPANSVHIGTIDIHITPPPTPAIQPVATTPKPVALGPLARGFTSSFGLRQG